MAQPKIIIIKKPGEEIDRKRAKRLRKLAEKWDEKPKTAKLSKRDYKRIERERKAQLEELADRYKKKKPRKRKKKSGFLSALKGAYGYARKKGGNSHGKGKKRRYKDGFGLSLGGYNI